MGGNLQATPHKENAKSHYAPLSRFCGNTGLDHITPEDIYTFTPAKTHIDHLLLRQSHTPQHYTIHNTNITTYAPEYGDHTALILDLVTGSLLNTNNHPIAI